VDVGDPLLVLTPNFDHGSGGLESLVEDTHCSVTEAGDENISRNLIGCKGCNTGTGSCRYVLMLAIILAKELQRAENTYHSTNFCRGIPDSDDFNVASNKSFPLSLLPVKH